MRRSLIAKDDAPCGIGSRFPRASSTSDNETMQSVTRRQAKKRERGGGKAGRASPRGK